METLFEITKINQTELKNRFVRSATSDRLINKDGSCNDSSISILEELSLGEVSLITTGHSYVEPEGKMHEGQQGIYSDHLITSYKEMVERIHRLGSKIVLQIGHGGGFANIKEPYGPSELSLTGYDCREMTIVEINKVVNKFKEAALRARKAGFDGIQIQAGHGFLLSQFLSPFFNRRKDYYGGSTRNRARIVLEIVHLIRTELGKNFLITVKINSDDFVESGFQPKEMVQVSELLEEASVNAIEMSGGTKIGRYGAYRNEFEVKSQNDEIYYRDAAKLFKRNVTIPLILVGGIWSYEIARELVETNLADYISLSRPLIREPNLVKRWKLGDLRRASCTSCNRCLVPYREGKGLTCVLDKQIENI